MGEGIMTIAIPASELKQKGGFTIPASEIARIKPVKPKPATFKEIAGRIVPITADEIRYRMKLRELLPGIEISPTVAMDDGRILSGHRKLSPPEIIQAWVQERTPGWTSPGIFAGMLTDPETYFGASSLLRGTTAKVAAKALPKAAKGKPRQSLPVETPTIETLPPKELTPARPYEIPLSNEVSPAESKILAEMKDMEKQAAVLSQGIEDLQMPKGLQVEEEKIRLLEAERERLVEHRLLAEGLEQEPSVLDNINRQIADKTAEINDIRVAVKTQPEFARERTLLPTKKAETLPEDFLDVLPATKKAAPPVKGAKTLIGYVKAGGGIDPKKIGADYNLKEVKQLGLMSALRKGGRGLDEWYNELYDLGYIPHCGDLNPGDHVYQQLQLQKGKPLKNTPAWERQLADEAEEYYSSLEGYHARADFAGNEKDTFVTKAFKAMEKNVEDEASTTDASRALQEVGDFFDQMAARLASPRLGVAGRLRILRAERSGLRGQAKGVRGGIALKKREEQVAREISLRKADRERAISEAALAPVEQKISAIEKELAQLRIAYAKLQGKLKEGKNPVAVTQSAKKIEQAIISKETAIKKFRKGTIVVDGQKMTVSEALAKAQATVTKTDLETPNYEIITNIGKHYEKHPHLKLPDTYDAGRFGFDKLTAWHKIKETARWMKDPQLYFKHRGMMPIYNLLYGGRMKATALATEYQKRVKDIFGGLNEKENKQFFYYKTAQQPNKLQDMEALGIPIPEFNDLTENTQVAIRKWEAFIEDISPQVETLKRKMGDENFALIDNYSPLYVRKGVKFEKAEGVAPYPTVEDTQFYRSLIKRKEITPFELYETNAYEVAKDWANGVATFLSAGEEQWKVSQIIRSKAFGNTVGKTTQNEILDYFNFIVAPGEKNIWEKFLLQPARQAAYIQTIALSLTTIAKQAISIVDLLATPLAKFGFTPKPLKEATHGLSPILLRRFDVDENIKSVFNKALYGGITYLDRVVARKNLSRMLQPSIEKIVGTKASVDIVELRKILQDAANELSSMMGGHAVEETPPAYRAEVGRSLLLLTSTLNKRFQFYIEKTVEGIQKKDAVVLAKIAAAVTLATYAELAINRATLEGGEDIKEALGNFMATLGGNIPAIGGLIYLWDNSRADMTMATLKAPKVALSAFVELTQGKKTIGEAAKAMSMAFIPKGIKSVMEGEKIRRAGGYRDKRGKLIVPITSKAEIARSYTKGKYGSLAVKRWIKEKKEKD